LVQIIVASTHVKNPIAYHANATCCRGCISKWHGIEKGRALNEEELQFIVTLIMGWIERQINEKGD